MKHKIIIFGNGTQAELAHYYFKNDSDYNIVGFCVDSQYLQESKFNGLNVFAFEDIEKYFSTQEHQFFIAIGYSKLNKVREEKYLQCKQKGYDVASYISSKANTFNATIGENCFILEYNNIQPYVTIKNNVTLWSGNHIGHHSVIMDNCFITSHCVISGNCTIKNNCFIGVNSTIRDDVTIGSHNIIGAGSTILKNTDDNSLFSPRQTELSKVPSNKIKL